VTNVTFVYETSSNTEENVAST